MRFLLVSILLTAFASCVVANADDDPNLWLEDVTGQKAFDWVRAQNQISVRVLESSSNFQSLNQRLLTILNSRERIPEVEKHGELHYNFWRDKENPRGLLRRTTLAEYKKDNPAWETVLDVDKLAASEKENWAFHGYQVLQPDEDRCLVTLSRGGTDAATIREFDLTSRQFVAGGFVVPEAKTDVTWRDRDTVYIGSDFGPGSLTSSGYPRLVKEWKRGQPLDAARLIFSGDTNDVAVSADVEHDHGVLREFIVRGKTFFSDEAFLREGDHWPQVFKPDDAEPTTFLGDFLFRLRSDWTIGGKTYKSGSLLAADIQSWMRGDNRHLEILFEPTERVSLQQMEAMDHYLALTLLDNVHSRIDLLKPAKGGWSRSSLDIPALGSVVLRAIDPEKSDDYFLLAQDFLTPSTLYLGSAESPAREKLKHLPSFFDANGLQARQFEAVSKDGVRVPYFLVGPKDLKMDGRNATLLTGYGGFQIAMTPAYNPTIGAGWLERGGVYVLANIRGGGEFGPDWHNAARKEHRQRAYDDFIAVAEDLIARGVTSPAHLGIQGRSNGGLLMGVMLTERPDLFGAIHCGSPLLDMRRYTKLLAGASWIDEYGDPDRPDDWAYIQKYSPYQNVRPGKYPPILITTSTRDDRVHPGHARKMARRLEEAGHDVLYYENIEGGHAAATDNKQAAYMSALAYTFLWNRLQ